MSTMSCHPAKAFRLRCQETNMNWNCNSRAIGKSFGPLVLKSTAKCFEKEKALNWTVEMFCRLVKKYTNVAQLITMLVKTHIFYFVVGRAFVTDIEKLKLSSKARALEVEKLLLYFSETTKDGIRPGANLLHAVEVLVSGTIDKQSFLDSGILSCLIHVLYPLLCPGGDGQRQKPNNNEELLFTEEACDAENRSVLRLEVVWKFYWRNYNLSCLALCLWFLMR